jgi:hypothetical protein
MIRIYDKTEYKIKQSKYKNVPILPMRCMITAQSGSGKSVLIQNMILNFYLGCFERIYIFSHSIDLDHSWQPVKDYLNKHYKGKHELFNNYDQEMLDKIITSQEITITILKENNKKEMYGILIVLDDMMDDKKAMRNNSLLEKLFIRGRHSYISTIVSVQKYISVSPVIRFNTSCDIIFKLRSQKDLDAIIEEYGALAPKNEILKRYKEIVNIPYNFVYINKLGKNFDEIFNNGFS